MAKNIFDILFVLSLFAPIVALIAGALVLAIPTTRLRWPTSTTRRTQTPAHI